MAAFTFDDLYKQAMVLWDKAGSSYLPKDQFDVFANIKYQDWVDLECGLLEQGEQVMSDLVYLFKPFSKTNSNTIDLPAEVPDYYKRIRFNMDYKDCFGNIKTAPIDIWQNNNVDALQIDPFNKATDEEPGTIATPLPNGSYGFQVFSINTPLKLNMTYVREPQVIDTANNPNTVFEGKAYIAYILVRLVVYRLDITIENLNRMKAEVADVEGAVRTT